MWIVTDKGKALMRKAENYIIDNIFNPTNEYLLESRRGWLSSLNYIDKTGKLPNWKYEVLKDEDLIEEV